MTEPTTETTEPESVENDARTAPDEPENDGATETPDDAQDGSRDERRASRYRAQLRAVESERDALRSALTPHVRAAVEAHVGDRLQDRSAVWLVATDPLALLDDKLAVDPAKVDDAVTKLLAAAPTLGKRFTGSADGGNRESVPASKPSWSGLIKPSS